MNANVALYDSSYSDFQTEVLSEVRRKTYDEDLGQTGWLTRAELERFLTWIPMQPGAKVLDIACGSGGLARRLASSLDVEVSGFDMNPKAIGAALDATQESGLEDRLSFQEANANGPLPYTDSSFDVAVSIDAMNHITNRNGILSECYRVLKRGGRFLFTDPVVVSGYVTKEEIDVRSSIGSYIFAPLDTTQEMIKKAGLRMVICEDATDNMTIVSTRWRNARAAKRKELVKMEGRKTFEGIQTYLDTVHLVAKEHRLSRYVFVAEKP